jgi:hypothetical protein
MFTLQFLGRLPERLDIERDIRDIVLQYAFHAPDTLRLEHVMAASCGGSFEKSRVSKSLSERISTNRGDSFALETLMDCIGDLRDRRRTRKLLCVVGVGEDALAAITEAPTTRYASLAFLLYATAAIAAKITMSEESITMQIGNKVAKSGVTRVACHSRSHRSFAVLLRNAGSLLLAHASGCSRC